MTGNWLQPPPTLRGRREGTAAGRRPLQLLQFGDLPPIVLCGNSTDVDHVNGGHHKKKNVMMEGGGGGGGGGGGEGSAYDDELEGAIKEHEHRLMANRRRKKRNGYKGTSTLKQRYEDGDPEVGLLGEASGRGDFEYYVLYSRPSNSKHDDQFCPNYLDVVPTGWEDDN